MSRVNVAQSHPQEWAYLSEGGSTIVFSYTGPFHPSFTGKVLRLRKISLEALHHRSIDEEDDDPVIAFQKTVIAPLVPSNFLPDLDVVLLDPGWLAALELLRDRDRPTERRAKDKIDRARQKGILATDLISGADILAIEIKVQSESPYVVDRSLTFLSPSGASCPMPLTCPRTLQRSRHPLAGSVCTRVSNSSMAILQPNIVHSICTRQTKHV